MQDTTIAVPRFILALSCAGALALGGCSQPSEPAQTSPTTQTSVVSPSPATSSPARPPSASATTRPLPDCPGRYEGRSTPDCVAEADGYRVTKTGRGESITVTVSRDGAAPQTITVRTDAVSGSGALLLRNLAPGADGPDILVSTSGSGAHGANANWSVWRRGAEGAPYRSAGRLYGGEFWDSGTGYLAQYSSGGGWAVTFGRFAGDGVQPGITVGQERTAGVGSPGAPDCTVLTANPGPPDPCGVALRQARERGLGT